LKSFHTNVNFHTKLHTGHKKRIRFLNVCNRLQIKLHTFYSKNKRQNKRQKFHTFCTLCVQCNVTKSMKKMLNFKACKTMHDKSLILMLCNFIVISFFRKYNLFSVFIIFMFLCGVNKTGKFPMQVIEHCFQGTFWLFFSGTHTEKVWKNHIFYLVK
jgi:hypothetical protein